MLNLPDELHSHGLRRLTAIESTRLSFDDARTSIERATRQKLGKRQLEALALHAAADFDGFYAERRRPPASAGDYLLVLSCDGKGVVMRTDALRPATAQAATQACPQTGNPAFQGRESAIVSAWPRSAAMRRAGRPGPKPRRERESG